ncbi:phenylalanine--tRNA ligase subunit beta [soil metagenome]
MNVPMKWLESFVQTGLTPRELAQRMTMAGLEAEKIDEIGAGWDKVFVGYVEKVVRHPDADRLVLATVTAGEHHLTVVTGAPNIAEGQNVALALAGARLIDGHSDSGEYKVLKPGTIRGVKSEGMVCSEKELGISDEHEGILVLPADAPVGTPLQEYLGDSVIEFEITPNLVHAFSVRGIAREAGAVTNSPVSEQPAFDAADLTNRVTSLVEIEATDLCSRFSATVIEGVKVGPSPEWLASRLTAAGVRPINNLVDITNYVMLELGQPMHAYDLRNIRGERLIVRRARDGERMEAIDHQERLLNADMLVIADTERVVGIAGVMGGVDSEVTDETSTILLEAANFDMKSVRHTSRALKLRTDASARFERGIDPNLVEDAMLRAIYLVLEASPGAKVTISQDVYPAPVERRTISFAFSRIERLLGVGFSEEHVIEVLSRLDMRPVISGETLTVSPPTYRKDVTIREDVIEEIARISGYEHLPETLPRGETAVVFRDRMYLAQEQLRVALVGAGLYEAVSYPVVGDDDLKSFTVDGSIGLAVSTPADALVRLKNPLQAERPYLRPTLVPSLLGIVRENLKHARSVRFFELSRGYIPTTADELPTETNLVGFAMAGARSELSTFQQPGEIDIFDLKGAVEEALTRLGAIGWSVEPAVHPSLHPGRSAKIVAGEQLLGWLGELRPDVARSLGFDVPRVAIAEFSLDAALKLVPERAGERKVPRFLPVEQDFAVVVDSTVPAAEVESTLRMAAGPLASGFVLFDIFQGTQIGEGKKSLAYRITFTAPDRALTDDDLGKVRVKIEKSLKQRVGGILRA